MTLIEERSYITENIMFEVFVPRRANHKLIISQCPPTVGSRFQTI